MNDETLSQVRSQDNSTALLSSEKPGQAQVGSALAGPQTSAEIAVAKIWSNVLGVSNVGLRDDFFALGGDSRLAVQVIDNIASVFGPELSIDEFFEAPTVEQVARKLARLSASEDGVQAARSGGPAPLSVAQQRLWFIDRREGGSTAYHVPLALRLRGELHLESLQAALNCIVSRHEVLRSVFIEVDGEPMQRVLPDGYLVLQRADLCGQDYVAVLEWLGREVASPFDLSVGPLIRGALLRLEPNDHILLITMHHIISDEWSRGVLIRELDALYGAYVSGAPDPLLPLRTQYSDYAAWQRQTLAEPQVQEQLEYWKEHLRGAPALIELPTDRPRPASQSNRGGNVPVLLGPELTSEIKALARQLNVTLAMALYTAWSIVLMRLSGQDDVVIGMPVAGRRRTEFEPLIGFFVNTLPVRVRCEDDPTIHELLRRVKEIILRAQAHQDVPFELVADALQPMRTLSFSPVAQVALVFHNAPAKALDLPGLIASAMDVPVRTAQFDLLLSLQESAEGVGGILNYASDLFDDVTIRRWVEHFRSVLRAMVLKPDEKASVIPLLGPQERQQVVELFNATEAPYPWEQLIHRQFEEQVERTPDATAVVHEEQALTYADLNGRANRLAKCLRARGVGPDDLVGLCTERGLEMLIGILGIWKAGGAYVPLDPQYPSERLAYMVEDAAPKVLLTQSRLRERLLHTAVEVIPLDDWEEMTGQLDENVAPTAFDERPDQLAYVIYTSGSTGLPKGVMIEHRSVLNLWEGLGQLYGGNDCERVALNASFNFDASVQQLIQLLSGRALYVIGQESRRDPERLLSFVAEHGIQGIDCTPSQLKLWVSAGLLERAGPLRVVLVGGEAIDTELWSELSRCAHIEFYNVYGPTECTVDATMARLRGDRTAPHIGRPMPNRRVLILDGQHQPVPIGVAGEIYIGGAGVARGYLNRPELTQERFVRDLFSAGARERMYRTGDLGRWRADGVIEYLGRNDQQVKIRGFRIELGEIEAQLLGHERVQECVVMAREDVPGEKRLVAYVCTRGDEGPRADELRAHLKSTLPEYMVPSAFVTLERLPLTPNGKLDRRALPVPQLDAYGNQQYEAPRAEAEEILAGIWRSLLGVERVGRQDNFFELGGDSLLIVQLLERLRRVGMSAAVRQVFDHPTLADLALVLTRGAEEQHAAPPDLIPPGCTTIEPQMLPLAELEPEHIERIVRSVLGGASNVQDIYPLVPLQEGILFHHLLDDRRGDTYVVSILLLVSSREHANELIAALQAVIDRHDVLRTAVLWEGLPRPMQVVCRQARLPVDEVELDKNRDSMSQVSSWLEPEHQRLDVRKAPLLRLRMAADPQSQQYYALLQIHHIVMDHVTIEAVISEVVAHLRGDAQQLPAAVPYRTHVTQSLAYARKYDAEAFFRGKLADVVESTAPFGLLDVHADGSQLEEFREEIEPNLARRIRVQARSLGITAATLFHAAWGLVVAHASGRDDVVFGSLLLGRLQGSAGAQRILGVFINTLPLRLRLQGVSAKALVEQTQRELVELLSHEQASLAAAQRCSGIVGSAPLFTALLNYRHSVVDSEALWSGARGIKMLAFHERTNYPITLSVDDLRENFTITASTRQIDPRRVTGYLHAVLNSLIHALEQAPQTPALALSILPQSEHREVIEIFNKTQAPYLQEKLIHQLFEAQVERTPKAVALEYEGKKLTYAELNARANQLARHLRERGVRPDELVGICVERSIEMVVGLFGILKAGGAYVPLDPDYPEERLAYMVADAAPRVLLTQHKLYERLPATAAEIIQLDAQWPQVALQEASNLDARELGLSPRQLAYMIYTSGSTGRPKGAMNEHRALINRLQWMQSAYRLDRTDRVLQKTPFSFDVSVWEFFWTLLNGAQLVIARPRGHQDPQYLRELIEAQQVTTLHFVPSMLQIFVDQLEKGQCPSLRHVVCSGEELPATLQRTFFERLPQARLSNLYGPTEAAIDVTSWECRQKDQGVRVPIGRPIWNTQMYILDPQGQPVPIGVTGELYIGGTGVGRGYHKRGELTAQRFVPDPYSADHGARLYKTGDLGRWRRDGAIEYLGRNDFQVKIRGLRIELGEIEAWLAQHEAIKEAAVLAREDVPGEKRLVAYVVRHPAAKATTEVLRDHVKAALPEYMVPSAFVLLEQFPLTPNGKLDRQALPVPGLRAYVSRKYEAPLGEVEETLARIWRSLLKVERVGRQDNFFELGGHSLLALHVLVKINQVARASVRVMDIYQNPTIRELAIRIERGATAREEWVDLSREAVLEPHVTALPLLPRTPVQHIFLTGATGFVGRFLLVQLLEETNATIHCLVRAHSAQEAALRVRRTLKAWHLWRDEFESRVVPIQGDLSLPRLGMTGSTYRKVCEDIDSIFHCGTSMNHLETYAMAKPANVDSARELLALATTGRPKLVHYISSLSVFGLSAFSEARVVRESTPIDHERHSAASGYVASKWVGEKIFMLASERGIPCNIFRIGLVWADTQRGRYDELQHAYRLLKSCLLSGCGIENYHQELSPTPVDYVARSVVFLAKRHSAGGGIFHISSPGEPNAGWFERCNEVANTSLRLLPFYEWVLEIKRRHNSGQSLPVVPLIEFAFSMDEKSFYEHRHRIQSGMFRVDCESTYRELENSGIVAPVLDDDLLRVTIDAIRRREELDLPRSRGQANVAV